MSNRRGWFGLFLAIIVLPLIMESAWAMSPRYTLLGLGQVLEVEAANLVKVRMRGRESVVTLRLLGVGSPRNRDRIKHLDPEVASYIQRHDVWEQAREYVRTLLERNTVEVWARRCDRVDEKNRLLAYVRIPQGPREPMDVNAEIIKSGLGFVTRDYVHVTFAGYKSLEEDAKRNRRGIWRALSMGRVSSLRK
jgi:endonuclease YncB( thermonuclease family)